MKPTLREQIENNLVWYALSLVVVSFVAGLGAYRTILEIAQLETVLT